MDTYDLLWLLFLAGLSAGWWGWSGQRRKKKEQSDLTSKEPNGRRPETRHQRATTMSKGDRKKLDRIKEQLDRDIAKRTDLKIQKNDPREEKEENKRVKA